jgi:hypothetical protein
MKAWIVAAVLVSAAPPAHAQTIMLGAGGWSLDFHACADSFGNLKAVVKELADRVAEATSYKDIEFSAFSDSGGNCGSLSVKSPIEAQIKELRQEADDLEAKLKAGKN